MRNILAAAVAVIALAASPAALAETKPSGDVTIGYVYSDTETNGAQGAETDTFAIGGRYALPISNGLALQLDGGYAYSELQDAPAGADDGDDTYGVTAHVFQRNGSFLVGGFVGAQDVDELTAYGGGAEVEYFFPDWTLGGRFTYATADDDDINADVDVFGFNAYGKFFLADNFSGRVGAGFGQADFDFAALADEEEEFWSVEASTEYLLTGLPLSLTAGVSYSDFDLLETTAVTVGARWNFGQTSLKARNRTGADLDGFATPVNF